MQDMHLDDLEKRYQCEDCGKGFMNKQRLNDHRINTEIFNDFDQNSGGQPNYSTI